MKKKATHTPKQSKQRKTVKVVPKQRKTIKVETPTKKPRKVVKPEPKRRKKLSDYTKPKRFNPLAPVYDYPITDKQQVIIGVHKLSNAFLSQCEKYETKHTEREYWDYINGKWTEVFDQPPPQVHLHWMKERIGYELQKQDFLNAGLSIPRKVHSRMVSLDRTIKQYVDHPAKEYKMLAGLKGSIKRRRMQSTEPKPPKEKKQRGLSITQAMFELFKQHGVEKVTIKQALKVARAIKPTTKFNDQHLRYYQLQYAKSGGRK